MVNGELEGINPAPSCDERVDNAAGALSKSCSNPATHRSGASYGVVLKHQFPFNGNKRATARLDSLLDLRVPSVSTKEIDGFVNSHS